MLERLCSHSLLTAELHYGGAQPWILVRTKPESQLVNFRPPAPCLFASLHPQLTLPFKKAFFVGLLGKKEHTLEPENTAGFWKASFSHQLSSLMNFLTTGELQRLGYIFKVIDSCFFMLELHCSG